MLVLSRKLNQEIVIGENVRIKILKVKGNSIRLGIEAPQDVRVVRGELPREESTATISIVQTDSSGTTYTESTPTVVPLRSRRQSGVMPRNDSNSTLGKRVVQDNPSDNQPNRLRQLAGAVTDRLAALRKFPVITGDQ